MRFGLWGFDAEGAGPCDARVLRRVGFTMRMRDGIVRVQGIGAAVLLALTAGVASAENEIQMGNR
ncbi:MAG: hypothetical protein AAFR40_18060, partial [Pseudomonadota bacterium]